jgi:hypothetical protein
VYEQVKMIRQKPEMAAYAARCALKRLITVHTLSVSDVGDRTKITFCDSSSRRFIDRCKCEHIDLYMLRQVVCLTKPIL